MPERSPYQGNSILSKEPRATTLNFCFAVSGGTWPAFSSVRKLGSARKSRSFDVPAFFPCSVAACPFLSLSLSWSWLDEDCGAVEGVGFAGGGVCCAADG